MIDATLRAAILSAACLAGTAALAQTSGGGTGGGGTGGGASVSTGATSGPGTAAGAGSVNSQIGAPTLPGQASGNANGTGLGGTAATGTRPASPTQNPTLPDSTVDMGRVRTPQTSSPCRQVSSAPGSAGATVGRDVSGVGAGTGPIIDDPNTASRPAGTTQPDVTGSTRSSNC
jgi:hypothetical protein